MPSNMYTYNKVNDALYSAIYRDKVAKSRNLNLVIHVEDAQNEENYNLIITNTLFLATYVPRNAFILTPGGQGTVSWYQNKDACELPAELVPQHFPDTAALLRDAIDKASVEYRAKSMNVELLTKVLGIFKKIGCKVIHHTSDNNPRHPVLLHAEVPYGGTLYALVMPCTD